jgi:hypothetical protein
MDAAMAPDEKLQVKPGFVGGGPDRTAVLSLVRQLPLSAMLTCVSQVSRERNPYSYPLSELVR